METDELISTLGVGYIDEMLQEYEHDCQWLQQIKADLGQQSRNMLNKANATLRCAMNDIGLSYSVIAYQAKDSRPMLIQLKKGIDVIIMPCIGVEPCRELHLKQE